jgi:hypothetical protein
MPVSGRIGLRQIEVRNEPAVLLVVGLALVTSWGCCLHGKSSGGRLHYTYTQVDEEACGLELAGQGQVTAIVQDAEGTAIPGVHVHLIQADAREQVVPTVTACATDRTGGATLLGRGDRYYTLLASALGYGPEARILLLKTGCSGSIHIRLHVVPTEGL